MRMWWEFAVVAVAGAVIGAVGVQMLHAQSPPRACIIAEVQVTDPEAYKPYIPKSAQSQRTRGAVGAPRQALDKEDTHR